MSVSLFRGPFGDKPNGIMRSARSALFGQFFPPMQPAGTDSAPDRVVRSSLKDKASVPQGQRTPKSHPDLSPAKVEREAERQSDVDTHERIGEEADDPSVAKLSDFGGAGALLRLGGFWIAWNPRGVVDPVCVADDREGVRTDRRDVFA
jgi:hypothetical protein